jgi:hypothetical protein
MDESAGHRQLGPPSLVLLTIAPRSLPLSLLGSAVRCWRVPNKLWQGLPDPNDCQDANKFHDALLTMTDCVLSGYMDLPAAERQRFLQHCSDKQNWAKRRKSKAKTEPQSTAANVDTHDDDAKPAATTSESSVSPAGNADAAAAGAVGTTRLVPRHDALVPGRAKFVTPIPGVNGASDATVFQGKRFVLTGTFPEIGGGTGLTQGKDRVKAMIEAFGGRVTGSVSGKTNVLVVGKEPGMSKVTQARDRPNIAMGSLKELKEGLDAGLPRLEDFEFVNRKEPLKIQNFSMGYQLKTGYNGLALAASRKDLEYAHGMSTPPPPSAKPAAAAPQKPPPPPTTPPLALPDDGDQKPAAKPTATKKRKRTGRRQAVPKANTAKAPPAANGTKEESSPTKAAPDAKAVTSGAIVVATAAAKAPSGSGNYMNDALFCEVCGDECTDESWFAAQLQKRCCPACYRKKGRRMRDAFVQQRHCQNVA